jgi:hypothetical protein
VRLSGGKFEILPYNWIMNKEVINDRLLYLNAPKMALDFLVENLGFVIYKDAVSKNVDSVKVCDGYGNLYEVFLNTRENENSTNNFKLIINTTDCLQDFYRMELKDIRILTRPHYVPEGLAFEILDYWNNRYTFLEKRDYTDQ